MLEIGSMRPTNNQRVVTATGTAERIKEDTSESLVIAILIRAHKTNTGNIYIGKQGVASTNGLILAAGEVVVLDVHDFKDGYIDLQKIWIDSDVNGEGISYIAWEVTQ